MCRTSPKGSHARKTCRRRASCAAAVSTASAPARAAATRPRVTAWTPVASSTWAILRPVAPSRSTSRSPATAAASAAAASPPICPPGPCPSACTPAASNAWPYASSSRTPCPTAPPPGTSGATTRSSSPTPRSKTGSRRREKKSQAEVQTHYLGRALESFSGYIAVDELYDGPFCVLSLVDNRSFRRLAYRVLEHDPTKEDVRSFLADFKAALTGRDLSLRGITTDGSSLYPEPLAELWPDVPPQVCRFHVLKEITKSVLHALARVRKELAQQVPQQPRGRPRQDAP